MTEAPRPVRENQLHCECGYKLGFVTNGGVILCTAPARWKAKDGKVVVQCAGCGKWLDVGGEK